MFKKSISFLAAVCILLSSCGISHAAAADIKEEPDMGPVYQFTDVKESDWFYDAVAFLYDTRISVGVTNTLFAPDKDLTRAEFVAFLARIAVRSRLIPVDDVLHFYDSSFKDVSKKQWYIGYVNWATDAGIIAGYTPTEFGPDDSVNTEQAAAIMIRFVRHYGLSLGQRDSYTQVDGSVSPWASSDFILFFDYGLGNNCPLDGADIKDGVTRARASQFLYNLVRRAELQLDPNI